MQPNSNSTTILSRRQRRPSAPQGTLCCTVLHPPLTSLSSSPMILSLFLATLISFLISCTTPAVQALPATTLQRSQQQRHAAILPPLGSFAPRLSEDASDIEEVQMPFDPEDDSEESASEMERARRGEEEKDNGVDGMEKQTSREQQEAKSPREMARPHADLFTRMRSICARMHRLKRKRTPRPGSPESLVAFLCSNTNFA